MSEPITSPPVGTQPVRPTAQHHLSSASSAYATKSTHHGVAGKYGPAAHVVYHDTEPLEEHKARTVRDLIRPPIIRQWIENGRIHREPSAREIPRFELFFDLLFVAIIHQLAIEHPGGPAVARFILTFWPSWSIWEEARKYSNVSGTDDLLHRVWILIGMVTILGYSVNASAIELDLHDHEELIFEHKAVQAATAFWLIIKLTRVLVLLYYAWRLPLFRKSQLMHAIAVFVPMLVYLVILASVAIVVDCMRIDIVTYNVYGRLMLWRQRKQRVREERAEAEAAGQSLGKRAWHSLPTEAINMRITAMNIEHAIERSSAFVVIVLGELVMNLLYVAGHSDLGASLKFGKASLGLMVAWALNYMYLLPSEPNAEYEHALRRSFLTASCFSFFHWPLCASLVLASAACGKMIAEEEVDKGVHWYWGCGLGFALFFINVIDLCHRETCPPFQARVPRYFRSILSLICSIALVLLPLASDMPSINYLGIAMGILFFLLAVNIYGVLPRASYAQQWDNEEGGNERDLHEQQGSGGQAYPSGEDRRDFDGVQTLGEPDDRGPSGRNTRRGDDEQGGGGVTLSMS